MYMCHEPYNVYNDYGNLMLPTNILYTYNIKIR